MLELILMRQEMGRPFAAPPGVPAERRARVARAFDRTLRDPDFRAEAERVQLEIDPLDARAIDELLASAYGAPKPVIVRAGALVDPFARKAD